MFHVFRKTENRKREPKRTFEEEDGAGKYLLRISLTVVLYVNELSTRGTHHHPQQARRTPHRCLFMGAAVPFSFFFIIFLVFFNGFFRWNEYEMDFSNLNSPLNKYFLTYLPNSGRFPSYLWINFITKYLIGKCLHTLYRTTCMLAVSVFWLSPYRWIKHSTIPTQSCYVCVFLFRLEL